MSLQSINVREPLAYITRAGVAVACAEKTWKGRERQKTVTRLDGGKQEGRGVQRNTLLMGKDPGGVSSRVAFVKVPTQQ